MAEDFNKISSTALLCAKIKAEYTNLPYTTDIYKLAIRDKEKWDGIVDSPFLKDAVKIPSFRDKLSVLEGRYIAINDTINTLTNCLILELSAGLSSRFLELSDRNFYAETDLPAMVSLKKKIHGRIDLHTSNFACTVNKNCTVIPSIQLSKICRITGAGDAWNAGNLFAELLNFDDDERLLFANLVAGCYIASSDPIHPSLEEIISFIRTGLISNI